MPSNVISYPLYFLNTLILITGIILISYYSNNKTHDKTFDEINCADGYFLSFMFLTNSTICLLLINSYISIGFITTTAIYSYTIYNINNLSRNCNLNNNMIWFYYLFCIIANGLNILLYIVAFIEYWRFKKKNKISIIIPTNDSENQHIIYANQRNNI